MKLSDIQKFIESNALGLATMDEQGQPHNIAVAYVKVKDERVVISNAHINQTIQNLAGNAKVALVVWNKEWETACVGFELIGTASNYTSGPWLDYVKGLPDNEGYEIASAIVVEVSEIRQLIS